MEEAFEEGQGPHGCRASDDDDEFKHRGKSSQHAGELMNNISDRT
jgi:hypothetical protein